MRMNLRVLRACTKRGSMLVREIVGVFFLIQSGRQEEGVVVTLTELASVEILSVQRVVQERLLASVRVCFWRYL